jgi:hypothetical protein
MIDIGVTGERHQTLQAQAYSKHLLPFKSRMFSALTVRGCLGVWLWLLFKVLFTQKSMPTIFFYFLKIIFEISTSR